MRIKGIFPNKKPTPKANAAEQQKLRAELEKLSVDTKIAKKNLKNYASQQRLEKTKVWLTFATSFIAVTGLVVTFYNQQHQLDALQQQHLDDDYSRKVDLLAKSTTIESKLASISNLSLYLNGEYSDEYRGRIIDLLLAFAEADSSAAVKESIKSELVKQTPKETLLALIEQNRSIVASLSTRNYLLLPLSVTDPVEMADDPKINALTWNIEVMIKCINKIRFIKDLDFSGTALNKVVIESSKDSTMDGNNLDTINVVTSTTTRPSGAIALMKKTSVDKDGIYFVTSTEIFRNVLVSTIQGDTFQNVKFNGSNLNGVFFTNSIFKNTSFDSSAIVLTQYNACLFDDQCSFKNIFWNSENGYLQDVLSAFLPTWQSCNINATDFSPIDTVTATKLDSKKFFLNSKWNFRHVTPDTMFVIPLKGDTGYDK